jgi:hypothetical protein
MSKNHPDGKPDKVQVISEDWLAVIIGLVLIGLVWIGLLSNVPWPLIGG